MAVYTSGATYVKRGFGQVEPNHLTAGYTGHVYAQLPANKDIQILENGQFVKYDQAKGEVNFTGKGAWMMVYNEIQLYRDYQTTADFAMIKNNYIASVYSPIAQSDSKTNHGVDTSAVTQTLDGDPYTRTLLALKTVGLMPTGTTMVPRVIKVEVGDFYTTNCIKATTLAVGDELHIDPADGYLTTDAGAGGDEDPTFVVDQVYTMPDMQPGVKIRRVA